jgi:ATP-dependent DNA helicase RecG
MVNNDSIFERPIQFIKGIGEKKAAEFKKLGIVKLYDFISYYPRTYEDRTQVCTISDAVNKEPSSIKVTIESRVEERRIRKGLALYKVVVKDDTAMMEALWFNQSYLKNTLLPGDKFIFYGSVVYENHKIKIQNPIFEKDTGNSFDKTCRIVPIYRATSGLTQFAIRNAIKHSLSDANGQLFEYMPDTIRKQYNLAEISYSINNIHFPESDDAFQNARTRLVFEELFLFQLGLLRIKKTFSDESRGPVFNEFSAAKKFEGKLLFKLTGAQKRVINEIIQDVSSDRVMNRLVQGDVGSGKTIIAALALLICVKSGYQGAFMAPTEILSHQHFNFLTDIFKNEGINVVLLTGGLTKKNKDNILKLISTGEANIIIGTHALLQESVRFSKLGMVITDEQHRFGVRQRAVLNDKGSNPHVLVMTATPIPRTLALILYGDLDISIIDELPPGRTPIKTYAVGEQMRARINDFIRKKVEEGRQVFIVCPLVEESESINAKAAIQHAEQYSKTYFPDLKTALIHGKMKSNKKNEIMKDYAEGNIDILISTTVIEVGVNVPNASIMVVENAERFGLAQLHQLRGRVGRGTNESFCILFHEGKTSTIAQRMKIMVNSNDGFVISEKDLEIRGPGDFFGTRQHGIPDFKIANLYQDVEVLKTAQTAAKDLFLIDPLLEKDENRKLAIHIEDIFRDIDPAQL